MSDPKVSITHSILSIEDNPLPVSHLRPERSPVLDVRVSHSKGGGCLNIDFSCSNVLCAMILPLPLLLHYFPVVLQVLNREVRNT